jgi:ribulose bisphosphate carboxylase small subunit
MVLAGVKAKLTLNEREDYIGGELVQLDPERHRPVMSVVTTRDDGQDTLVFAPTASARR